jgi:hypothetical protein
MNHVISRQTTEAACSEDPDLRELLAELARQNTEFQERLLSVVGGLLHGHAELLGIVESLSQELAELGQAPARRHATELTERAERAEKLVASARAS